MEIQNQFFIQLSKFLELEQGALPIFSAVSLQLQLELIKNDPDIKIVEKLIVADQSLSSTVLKIANSVRYCGLVETTTVKSAIVRLGMSEIMRIVSTDISNKIFSSSDSQINAIMKKLWQHSVGCAFAAGILSNSTACGLVQEEAFTAGLFHDIGKLLILKVVEEKKKKYKLFAIPNELLLASMDALHANHGYRLLNRIKLPRMYALVARDHHLERYNRQNLLLVLVKLANTICHQMGIGFVHNPSLDIMKTEEALLLNLTDPDLDKLRKYLLNTTNLME
jgi:HD-like signal output (HDOD) protein